MQKTIMLIEQYGEEEIPTLSDLLWSKFPHSVVRSSMGAILADNLETLPNPVFVLSLQKDTYQQGLRKVRRLQDHCPHAGIIVYSENTEYDAEAANEPRFVVVSNWLLEQIAKEPNQLQELVERALLLARQ